MHALGLALPLCCVPVVPFRLLLLAGGTARWSKKLLGALKRRMPGTKKPSEADNFLLRSPTSIALEPTKIHLDKRLRKA